MLLKQKFFIISSIWFFSKETFFPILNVYSCFWRPCFISKIHGVPALRDYFANLVSDFDWTLDWDLEAWFSLRHYHSSSFSIRTDKRRLKLANLYNSMSQHNIESQYEGISKVPMNSPLVSRGGRFFAFSTVRRKSIFTIVKSLYLWDIAG